MHWISIGNIWISLSALPKPVLLLSLLLLLLIGVVGVVHMQAQLHTCLAFVWLDILIRLVLRSSRNLPDLDASMNLCDLISRVSTSSAFVRPPLGANKVEKSSFDSMFLGSVEKLKSRNEFDAVLFWNILLDWNVDEAAPLVGDHALWLAFS